MQPVIVEFTVRLGYAIFTVADAVVPRPRHPAAVARLGPAGLGGVRPICGGVWWPTLFPALAIATLVIGVNLIADGAGGRCSTDERDDARAPTPSSVARPRRRLPRARRRPPGAAVAQLHDRGGRVVRPGRRVRLRQVDRGAGRRALPAAQRQGERRARSASPASDLLAMSRRRSAPHRGRAPSRWSTRIPARRSTRRSASGGQVAEVFEVGGVAEDEARERAQAMLAQGADRRPGQRDGALPAPAVGRHAAARRDRDGAGHEPGAADPRRADHRPRRDGRGRGARPGRRAARRVRQLGAVHQPQPRR